MSFRTDVFRSYVDTPNAMGGTLASQTYVGGSGGGGSEVGEMISCFLNIGVGLATTALSAKSQSASAEQASMTKAMSTVTTGMTTFTTAKASYQLALKDLENLEAKKEAAGKVDQMQQEVDSLETSFMGTAESPNNQNKELKAKYDTISGEIKTLQENKTKLANLKGVISDNESQAAEVKTGSTVIGTSGLSVSYTGNAQSDAGLAAKTVEGGKNSNPRYYKADPNDKTGQTKIFMQGLYDQDMQAANAMDAQQQKSIAAKNAIEAANAEIRKLGLDGETPQSMDAKIQAKQSELQGVENTMMNGSGENDKLSFAQYNAKMSSLKGNLKEAQDAKNDKTLDSQIATAKKNVETKKAKFDQVRETLVQTKAQLEATKAQMETLSDGSLVNDKKKEYKAAKADDKSHRNFFQKMLGTGRGQDVKDAKKLYKDAKANQKESNQHFTELNGFSANARNIAQINSQIAAIDKLLTEQ